MTILQPICWFNAIISSINPHKTVPKRPKFSIKIKIQKKFLKDNKNNFPVGLDKLHWSFGGLQTGSALKILMVRLWHFCLDNFYKPFLKHYMYFSYRSHSMYFLQIPIPYLIYHLMPCRDNTYNSIKTNPKYYRWTKNTPLSFSTTTWETTQKSNNT